MSSVSDVTSAAAYQASSTAKPSATKESAPKKTEEKTETKDKSRDSEKAAVYEKSSNSASEKKPTYSINKMSEEDRAALVNQLKADQEARQSQLANLVRDMMNGQGKSYSLATGDDSIWKFLASGEFTVDPATKAQAQEDISENGYWGVKETSQRMFDFASALAGDNPEKMKKMQEAMMKGYEEATGAWGRDLPDISKQTIDAANKLFEDYYASKGIKE